MAEKNDRLCVVDDTKETKNWSAFGQLAQKRLPSNPRPTIRERSVPRDLFNHKDRVRQRLSLGSIASQARRYHEASRATVADLVRTVPSGFGAGRAVVTGGDLERVQWAQSMIGEGRITHDLLGQLGVEDKRVRKKPQLSAEFIPRPGMTSPDDNLVKRNGDLAEWSNEMLSWPSHPRAVREALGSHTAGFMRSSDEMRLREPQAEDIIWLGDEVDMLFAKVPRKYRGAEERS
ncbi:hypothetical protein DFH09DRAFT_1085659 [Mycena vulgaris]|nr:hypothetical protein DFH09DRAFT_1085659 [Mycena vulgaris]